MKSGLLMVLGATLILLFAAGCTQGGSAQSQGRTVFMVTDAAADMGTVTSVKVTVDSLQVHSSARGWETVSSSPYTYDLLRLKATGNQALLADVKLEAGTYEQVRLAISNVMVTDSLGTHTAKLPSGELKIVGGFEVKSNNTTAVTFDFLADQSLHITGNGQYILAPVVRMKGYADAEVNASIRENVKVKGGRMRTDIVVGMDADGNVGEGRRIAFGLNLTILPNGKIMSRSISREGGDEGVGAEVREPVVGADVSGSVRVDSGINSLCSGQSGVELGDCIEARAVEVNDVTVCSNLVDREERNTCIADWCANKRDFSTCDQFSDNDDRLLCMYKCSPNQMK